MSAFEFRPRHFTEYYKWSSYLGLGRAFCLFGFFLVFVFIWIFLWITGFLVGSLVFVILILAVLILAVLPRFWRYFLLILDTINQEPMPCPPFAQCWTTIYVLYIMVKLNHTWQERIKIPRLACVAFDRWCYLNRFSYIWSRFWRSSSKQSGNGVTEFWKTANRSLS